MIIQRRISIALHITDCIGIYTDPNNILTLVVNTYEGVCYNGVYILKVLRVVMIGDCEINKDGAPGFGTIPVMFDAEALVYLPGEIINGCVIQKHDETIILCSTPLANILIKNQPSTASLTTGQMISVRVGRAGYTPMVNKVAITAIVFIPDKTFTVYKIVPPVVTKAAAQEYLKDTIMRIEEEKKRVEGFTAGNAKGIAFFTQALYAYTSPQQPPTGAKIVDLMTLISSDGPPMPHYISRDRRIDLTTANVYVYDAPPAGLNVQEMNTQNVLVSMFEDYCMFLRTLRESLEYYSTPDLLLSHKNLWTIYAKSKTMDN